MAHSSISCGRDLSSVTDLANVLEQCGEKGFDFITAPIVHPRFQREFFQAVAQRRGPVTRSDKVIKVSDWSSLIVAKLSPWIQLDSSDPMVRRNSEKAFFEEMNQAIHLNMSAILIPLRSMACENLARCINHILLQNNHHVIAWLLLSTSNRRKLLEAKDENGCTPIELAERGPGSKSKVLAQKLRNWSVNSTHMRRLPWLIWTCFAVLPALDLLLALYLFSHVHQPVGLLLALAVAWMLFFLPLAFHRIPHDAGWQNPTSMMGLVIGFSYTSLCYIVKIMPRLWPSNWIEVLVLVGISLYGLFLFYKLKRTNPGFDKVGRLDDDGRRLTIVDVAKQGKLSGQETRASTHASPDYFAFCTYCEIVIPDCTKHCKLCNACCNGFDHHCTWLTSCIGYNNHRLFVLFLMVLAVINFTFLWDSFRVFSVVAGGSYNVWTLLVVGCTQEHWIMLLVICNSVSLAFSVANLLGQLSNISKMETTFFDVSGRRAYNTTRKGNPFSPQTRFHLLYLFFADYKRWFNRPVLKASNACYPKADI